MTLDDTIEGIERCARRAAALAERVRSGVQGLHRSADDTDWHSPASRAMRDALDGRTREALAAGEYLDEAAGLLRRHAQRARDRAIALEQAADLARQVLGEPVLSGGSGALFGADG